MSSLRLALKQSLEVASAEGVAIPKKKVHRTKPAHAVVKQHRLKSVHDDGHNSDSSEENEASLQDLDESTDSGSSEEEDGEIVGTPEKSNSGHPHNQQQLHHHTAAHKIQSQFRKKKDKKSGREMGSSSSVFRTKKMKRRSIETNDSSNTGNQLETGDGITALDGENGNSSDESGAWTVAPPSAAILNHMVGLSIETSRRTMTTGLRVKVHFDGSAWYGGQVSGVSNDGAEIRIRYDDGTREVAPFPDLANNGSVDIVVDAVQNGQHAASAAEAAQVFLPAPPLAARPLLAIENPPSVSQPEPVVGHVPSETTATIGPQPEQPPIPMEVVPLSIVKTDSREEGELPEPYEQAAEQSNSTEVSKPEASVSDVSKPEATSSDVAKPEAIAVSQAKEESTPISGDAVMPLSVSAPEPVLANKTTNADENRGALPSVLLEAKPAGVGDGHMDEADAIEDGSPKPKRKRGRPPKHRPSDASDSGLVDTPLVERSTTAFVGSGKVDEAVRSISLALPERETTEAVRIIPSLKIRMPKSYGETGLKTPKSPRTPRSPAVDIEAAPQSPAASSHGDAQRKRSLEDSTLSLDQPPTKKLSIRIPILKVRPTIPEAGMQSPAPEKSISPKVAKNDVTERMLLDGVEPARLPTAAEPGDKKSKRAEHGGSVLQKSSVGSPMSPKQIKKMKKKKALLSAVAASLGQTVAKDAHGPQKTSIDEASLAGNEFTSSSMAFAVKDEKADDSPDLAINDQKVAVTADVEVTMAPEERGPLIADEFGVIDFSLDGPIRSERKAAQQANERIVAKQDAALPVQLTGKKKKKRDRQKDAEGAISSRGVDELENDSQWAQCDKCGKWRVIPSHVVETLPTQWYCSDNKYDLLRASCDAPEQTDKEVLKEKKKRMKKRQRLMKAVESQEQTVADGSTTPKVDKATVELPARKEKTLDLVKSPRPARDVPDDAEKPPKPAKRTSSAASVSLALDDDIPPRGDTLDVRSRKEKKGLGKKGRAAAEAAEKALAAAAAVAAPEDVAPTVEVVKPRGRGRPRRNQGKESTTEAMAAAAPTGGAGQGPLPAGDDADNLEWVQCEKCDKWRKLPPHVSAHDLPDIWTCSLNDWNPMAASCDAPEDKAEGLQDIGVFGNSGAAGAGKLTYRHLIFGSTGRKANRPITERTRAAESLFATQFDEEDAPSKVLYADSSCYVYRGKANAPPSEDAAGMSMLELMSHSHLWRELRGENHPISNSLMSNQLNVNAYTFDTLPLDIQRAIKEYVLHVMDIGTFSGDEIVGQAKEVAVDSLPESMRKAYIYCTKNVIITTLCQLVKEGEVDCIQKIRSSWPIRDWNPVYRRAMKRLPQPEAPPPLPPPSSQQQLKQQQPPPLPAQTARKAPSATPKTSRFLKISKPWKYANTSVEANTV